MSPKLALVLVLVLVLVPRVHAQDAVTARDLDGSSWAERRGKTLSLDAKLTGLFGDDLRVAKVAPGKLLLDASSSPELDELAQELAGFRLGGVLLDRKGRSNVRITGTAFDSKEAGRALRVTSVVKVLDDRARFEERAKEKGADLLALAKVAKAVAAEWSEPDVAEWSRAAFEAALDATRSAVAEPRAALALARDYRDLAQVTSKAIAVLSEHAQDAKVRAALVELDAVQHRDRWISRDELRARLGYVKLSGRWVTALHAELEAEVVKQRAVAKARTFSLRDLLPPAYEKAANEKRLATGMFKQEVAVAKGFPRQVERITDAEGVSWDQWVFEDGGRAYFRAARGEEALLASWR